jgi:YidC/Oxa1 family membrane protein insertase
MQQQKNVLLFFVLSLLILAGGLWLQQKLGLLPQRRPPNAQPERKEVAKKEQGTPWARLSPNEKRVIAGRLVATAGSGTVLQTIIEGVLPTREQKLLAMAPPKPKPEVKPPPVKAVVIPHREFWLGQPSWFIRAKLTSKGAAIQQLFLDKFQKADRYARPVWEADGKTPAPLELIPDDAVDPSYALYLYRPGKEVPLPLLGEVQWQVDEAATIREVGDDGRPFYRQVTFYTDVAEQGLRITTNPADADLRITKTFKLAPADYHIELEVKVENRKTDPQTVRYQLAGARGLPIEGEWFTSTFRNGVIGWVDAKGTPLRQLEESRQIGFRSGGDEVKRSEESEGKEAIPIEYAGITNQYFASLAVVDNEQENRKFLEKARATVEGDANEKKPYLNDITMRVMTAPIELKANKPVVHKYLLYNGPLKVRLLGQFRGDEALDPKLVERYENTLHLKTLTDYHSSSWIGSFSSKIYWTQLLIACTNLMHWLLGVLHRFIMPWSYGLCIILLTVIVRGAMFPISRKQALTAMKMQELGPELAKLKEKHKDDPQAMGRAQWELYGRHGINPLGGCLPLLLQMPIFLGLYYALQESIFFRLEPLPILGSYWIKNLAAPDMLIPWSEKIPIISVPEAQGSFLYLGPYFNLLPVIAVILSIIVQSLMSPPAADEQQAMQQKMMKYMMIFMGLIFYKLAAGLCLYFIASSLWGVAERKLLPKRKHAPAVAVAAGGGGGASPRPARARSRGPRTSGNSDGVVQKVKDWWQEILKQAKKK